MNAITRVDAPRGCTPRSPLHLSAVAFAYPVGEGLLDFREASGYLARAAIRQGALDGDLPLPAFNTLLERLDRTIGEAILENEAKVAGEIRAWLRMCVARSMLDPVTIREVSLAINDKHGSMLPMRCVKFLIASEVPRG